MDLALNNPQRLICHKIQLPTIRLDIKQITLTSEDKIIIDGLGMPVKSIDSLFQIKLKSCPPDTANNIILKQAYKYL